MTQDMKRVIQNISHKNDIITKKLILLFIAFLLAPNLCRGAEGYTNSIYVRLIPSATDGGSGITPGGEMRFSNDNASWSEPEIYSEFKDNWDLTAYGGTAQDGVKYVYARFMDAASNWTTEEINVSIILDTIPPTTGAVPGGGSYNQEQQVVLSTTEGAVIYFTMDGTTPTTSSPVYGQPITIASDTILKFFAVDLAENMEEIKQEEYIINQIVDETPPSIKSLSPTPGQSNVLTNETLYITMEDIESGIEPSSIVLKIDAIPVSYELSGSPTLYTISYSPQGGWGYDRLVDVNIIAQDLAVPPNTLDYSYQFTTITQINETGVLRINVGGDEYEDLYGNIWLADQSYEVGGEWGYIDGYPVSTADEIADTDDDPLYQIQRCGIDEYKFDLDNGRYLVILHFAEITYEKAGKRWFGIRLEGELITRHLDIYKRFGHDNAVFIGLITEVSDGQLNIEFAPIINLQQIAALEIVSLEELASPDITPPIASEITPVPGAENIPIGTSISLVLLDEESGIDIFSIWMYINGWWFKPNITGIPFAYHVSYPFTYKYSGGVLVIVRAADKAGNPLSTVYWAYTVKGAL